MRLYYFQNHNSNKLIASELNQLYKHNLLIPQFGTISSIHPGSISVTQRI